MSYYTHHRHTDPGWYVHIDVTLRHSGNLVPSYTKHKHTNDPHHIHVDVHSEDPVKKRKINIFEK